MPTNVNVCINGFVLSTLIFDCGNDSGDQEGFLYGSITRNVRSEISDQSMNNTQEDILISICSSVPCGSFLSFYNNVGEINREDLEYNLGERVENIVGWYRFRRYSAMYPSVREQVAHRNLRAVFAPHSNMDDQFFVFGLLSSSNLPNYATHSFDYAFFTQRMDNTFRNLNFTILNLGDTRNSYRAGSLALPFMNSSSFNSVLSSSWNFNTFYDTEDQIQQFHNRLRNKLECLQEELAASDAVNATLEDDIRRISNEMQSLLATQERLSIAAARERETAVTSDKDAVETQESSDSNDDVNDTESTDLKEKEYTDLKEKEGSDLKEKECTDLKEKEDSDLKEKEDLDLKEKECSDLKEKECSDLKERECSDLKEKECTDLKDDEIEKKEPSEVQEGKGSQQLKRPAVESVDSNRSTKRVCSDKYFENEENQNEKTVEKLATGSVDEVTPESSPKDDDTVVSCLVIDPDNGELSTAQDEVSATVDVQSSDFEKNMVPSPANTIEIEVSDSGMKNTGKLEDCSISSSEESSNIKPPFIVYASKESDVPESSDSSTSAKTSKLPDEPEPEELPVDTKGIESSQSSTHDQTEEEKKESQSIEENKQ